MADPRWVWFRSSVLVALGSDAAETEADAVGSAVRDGADIDHILTVLTHHGLTRTPSFLCASATSDGVRVLVRGEIAAIADRGGHGRDEVTAGRSATWRDDVLADVEAIEIVDGSGARLTWIPTATADTVSLRSSSESEAADGADDNALAATIPPMEPSDEMAQSRDGGAPPEDHEDHLTTLAGVPEVVPSPADPLGSAEFDFSNLLDNTKFREVEAAAVREDGTPPAQTGDDPAEAEPAPTVGDGAREPADPAPAVAVPAAETTLDPAVDPPTPKPAEPPAPPSPDTGRLISAIPPGSDQATPPPPPTAASPVTPTTEPPAPPAPAPPTDPSYAHLPPPPASPPPPTPPPPPPAQAPPPPPPSGTAPPPPPPTAPTPTVGDGLGDHDGHTISIGDLHRSEVQDTLMPDEPGETDVRAIHCPSNHANPPSARSCRICGQELAVRAVRIVPRPVLARLTFDNGLIVELDRPQLIGRRPTAEGYEHRTEIPNLITLPSPDKDLSRLHTAIHLEGWDILVEDLGSTNGTEVRLPGQDPIRLRDHMPVLVVPGTEVRLAGVVHFAIGVPT